MSCSRRSMRESIFRECVTQALTQAVISASSSRTAVPAMFRPRISGGQPACRCSRHICDSCIASASRHVVAGEISAIWCTRPLHFAAPRPIAAKKRIRVARSVAWQPANKQIQINPLARPQVLDSAQRGKFYHALRQSPWRSVPSSRGSADPRNIQAPDPVSRTNKHGRLQCSAWQPVLDRQAPFARALEPLRSLLLLGTRLWVSWQFLKSGWLKLATWDVTLELFRSEYQVPLLPPGVAAVAGTFGRTRVPAAARSRPADPRRRHWDSSPSTLLAVVSYWHVLGGEGLKPHSRNILVGFHAGGGGAVRRRRHLARPVVRPRHRLPTVVATNSEGAYTRRTHWKEHWSMAVMPPGEQLEFLAASLARARGEDFFPALAEYLGTILGSREAAICEAAAPRRARTLAGGGQPARSRTTNTILQALRARGSTTGSRCWSRSMSRPTPERPREDIRISESRWRRRTVWCSGTVRVVRPCGRAAAPCSAQ